MQCKTAKICFEPMQQLCSRSHCLSPSNNHRHVPFNITSNSAYLPYNLVYSSWEHVIHVSHISIPPALLIFWKWCLKTKHSYYLPIMKSWSTSAVRLHCKTGKTFSTFLSDYISSALHLTRTQSFMYLTTPTKSSHSSQLLTFPTDGPYRFVCFFSFTANAL